MNEIKNRLLTNGSLECSIFTGRRFFVVYCLRRRYVSYDYRLSESVILVHIPNGAQGAHQDHK